MSDPALAQVAALEALLGQVADDFTERLQRGEQPDIEEYVRRHPDLGDLLRQVLAAVQVMGPADLEPLSATAESVAPTVLTGCLGDYRILREIGRGGMGVVYEAEQISLGRRVALKVLPLAATLDPKQLQRFKNEAQAAAGLQHQHIVPVYAVGCERAVHFYAMQFIEGQNLAAMIRDLRQPAAQVPVTPAGETVNQHAGLVTQRSTQQVAFFRAVAQLGIQAAEALEHAHQLGVLHRDIKPANLLVDVRGNLWVADFGLAHCQGQAVLTMTGDLVGTLRYMSPEQALANRVLVDQRTDIYSLGVTLYELLTLEPAFPGRDRQELLRQIAFEEPRPPRRLNPSLPVELETILLKAMAKTPEERYTTSQELADDLQRYLKDEPLRARRPRLWQRARRWARRHRSVVSAAAVSAALVVLVALAALLASHARIAQERDEKDEALRQAERQRRAADANLQLARQTMDDVYLHFAYLLDGRVPRLQPQMRVALEHALLFYQQLAQDPGTDAEHQWWVAHAHARMGHIHHTLGRRLQAEAAYDKAVALLQTLVAADPASRRPRAELAAVYRGLGILCHETNRRQQAEQAWRKAIALGTALADEAPGEPNYRYDLATVHNNLAAVLPPAEAEAACRTAIRLCEKLVADRPDAPFYRGELVLGYLSLSKVLVSAGQRLPAEQALRQAIALYREGADALQTGYYHFLLPEAYLALAQLLRGSAGHDKEAEDAYRLALASYEQLVAEVPAGTEYWIGLTAAQEGLVSLLTKGGRRQEAVEVYVRSVALHMKHAGPSSEDATHFTTTNRYLSQFAHLVGPAEREKLWRQRAAVARARAARFPAQLSWSYGAGYCDNCLGLALSAQGRNTEACAAFGRAAADYQAVCQADPNHDKSLNNLAWLLATCPEEEIRDGGRAVPLAQRAVALKPQSATFWNTLGAAHYRAGDWQAAVTALEKAMLLVAARPEAARGESYNTFFLAMAHWRLGDKHKAQALRQQAVHWMDKHQPHDEELGRFRAEAATVLGQEPVKTARCWESSWTQFNSK